MLNIELEAYLLSSHFSYIQGQTTFGLLPSGEDGEPRST